MDLMEENRRLKEEINSIKENYKLGKKLVIEKSAYWEINGNEKNGPFCSGCWDNNNKLIRIQKKPTAVRINICPVCGATTKSE